MPTYLVSYDINIDAPTPTRAAKALAEMLASDPAIPRRGVYNVTHGKKTDSIDLDEPRNGGGGYFN